MAYSTNCIYFNEKIQNFSDAGCRVGPRSSSLATQCYCNHLTDFSTVFKQPNLKMNKGAFELKGLNLNPVPFSFCLACFCLYFVILIWARRADLDDAKKVFTLGNCFSLMFSVDPFEFYDVSLIFTNLFLRLYLSIFMLVTGNIRVLPYGEKETIIIQKKQFGEINWLTLRWIAIWTFRFSTLLVMVIRLLIQYHGPRS